MLECQGRERGRGWGEEIIPQGKYMYLEKRRGKLSTPQHQVCAHTNQCLTEALLDKGRPIIEQGIYCWGVCVCVPGSTCLDKCALPLMNCLLSLVWGLVQISAVCSWQAKKRASVVDLTQPLKDTQNLTYYTYKYTHTGAHASTHPCTHWSSHCHPNKPAPERQGFPSTQNESYSTIIALWSLEIKGQWINPKN